MKIGDRIRLVSMGPDPDPILAGSIGTVTGVASIPSAVRMKSDLHVGVSWDNGRTLSVVLPADVVEIIVEPFPI